nr:alpha-amylase family glycosyl hydrolase [uncultured Mucilaginibacter sp.]
MKRNLLILSLFIAVLCTQQRTLLAQEVISEPKQYGKPFKNVPDRRDVSIYQVNIRTFGKNGDLKGVTERLDSIAALGVNVIYLMPIYPVGVLKAVNSPYCISDYTAVSKEFGTLEDLRQLVAAAHNRNLAVILDWVGNHTAYDHVWTKNKSWYLQDSTGNIISPPNMGWRDVAQLNFKNRDMRQAMISAMKYWVSAANVDGFRCDYSDGPPFDFWKQALDTLKSIPNHKLLLLSEGSRRDHYKAGFDYNFGFNFFGDLKAIFNRNRPVLSIDSLNIADYKGTEEGQQIVRYTTNHDVNSSDGTPEELFGGKKGAMAAFVVIAYMKSVPMIYNGQEVGTPYRLLFPFTAKKIDWSLNPDVTAEYKKIIKFRNDSKAIRRGKLTSYSSADVCAFTKEDGSERVFVLSNLRNKQVTYTVPESLSRTNWKIVFTGAKMEAPNSITLGPYSYLVLKN